MAAGGGYLLLSEKSDLAPTASPPVRQMSKDLSETKTSPFEWAEGGSADEGPVSVALLCKGRLPPTVPSARLRGVLEKNGGGPAWCAAVVDVSGELAFLRVCLQQWPDSPDLLTRGMNLESTPEARAACAERLTEVEPDNSSGYYGLAARCAEAEDFAAMLRYLRAALNARAPLDESPEVGPARLELWREAGFSEMEATLYNSCATRNHLRHALTLSRCLDALKSRLSKLSSESEREELAMLGVACAEHFRRTDGVVMNLLAMEAQILFLRAIDPKMAFGDTGHTVQSQLLIVEKDLEAVRGEFAAPGENTEQVTEEEFVDPYNFWMALAEYNAFRRLTKGSGGLPGRQSDR